MLAHPRHLAGVGGWTALGLVLGPFPSVERLVQVVVVVESPSKVGTVAPYQRVVAIIFQPLEPIWMVVAGDDLHDISPGVVIDVFEKDYRLIVGKAPGAFRVLCQPLEE